MSDRLCDFIVATNQAKTLDELHRLFEHEVAKEGYDRFLYVLADEDLDHPYPEVRRMKHNYPDDWMKFYEDNELLTIDPIPSFGHQARRAFRCDDLPKYLSLSREQKDCLVQRGEAGLHSGICVPLHAPPGERAVVTVATSDPNRDPTTILVDRMSLLSQQFHAAQVALLDTTFSVPKVRLSRREREVLVWCAQGKSNWEIGEILGVSENTVRYFIKQCTFKLQTTSKITTVLKAIRLSLIAP